MIAGGLLIFRQPTTKTRWRWGATIRTDQNWDREYISIMQTVKTIVHPDGTRKVDVFRRTNGSFGFEEWHWQVRESCWCPFGKYSIAVVDTMEHVLQEIKERIPWVEGVLTSPPRGRTR
jgi:hypothetical protein